jgi:hypothetical protein
MAGTGQPSKPARFPLSAFSFFAASLSFIVLLTKEGDNGSKRESTGANGRSKS